MDMCSTFLRHIPQRVAHVVTHAVVHAGAPLQMPFVDTMEQCVVVDVQCTSFRRILQADDFAAPDSAFLSSVLRSVARTGGDVVSLRANGLCAVWSSNPRGATPVVDLLRAAIVCAFEVQDVAQRLGGGDGAGSASPSAAGNSGTSAKAGIAVGRACLVHVGGTNGHKRYVVVAGPAHGTASDAVKLAGSSEIAVCPDSFKLVQDRFQHRAMRQRFYVLLRNRESLDQVELPGGPRSPFVDAATGKLTASVEQVEELEVESELEAYVPLHVSSSASVYEPSKDDWLATRDHGAMLCVCAAVDLAGLGRSAGANGGGGDEDPSLTMLQALVEATQDVLARHCGLLANVTHTISSGTASGAGKALPGVISLLCCFGPTAATHEVEVCRAVWAAVSLLPLFAEAGVAGLAFGLSVGQLRPGVVFDDPVEAATAHWGMFGAAAVTAVDLAGGFIVSAAAAAAAAKAAAAVGAAATGLSKSRGSSNGGAVVACDDDFVQTLASVSGVRVVELLSAFEKTSLPGSDDDVWCLRLSGSSSAASPGMGTPRSSTAPAPPIISQLEDVIYPQDMHVRRRGENVDELHSLDRPVLESVLESWDKTAARVVLVEGGHGTGKTTLLRRLLQTTVPARYSDALAAGATLYPLVRARPFGAVAKIVLNYIQGWLVRGARLSRTGATAADAVQVEVAALLAGLPGGLKDLAPLLDAPLNLPFAPTPASDVVRRTGGEAGVEVTRRALLLLLLQQVLGREGTAMLFVDNGLCCDEQSWSVLEDLVAAPSAEALRTRWRDLYDDAVPPAVADAARSFKGSGNLPVLVMVFQRPPSDNADCLTAEATAAIESLRAQPGCTSVRMVTWGGPRYQAGSLTKEQSAVVDAALLQIAARTMAAASMRRASSEFRGLPGNSGIVGVGGVVGGGGGGGRPGGGPGSPAVATPLKVRSGVIKILKALCEGTFLLATEIAVLMNGLGDAAVVHSAASNEVRA
jgi:hypothetical protein